MNPLRARFSGLKDSLLRKRLSPERMEIATAVLFTVFLVMGTTFWDTSLAQDCWPAVTACACLSILFLSLCRRKGPLLLCAAAFVATRLAFAYAESALAENGQFLADCIAVCCLFSALVFRTYFASAARTVRNAFAERPHRRRVPQPHLRPEPVIAAAD